jgi:hypothetical protein
VITEAMVCECGHHRYQHPKEFCTATWHEPGRSGVITCICTCFTDGES